MRGAPNPNVITFHTQRPISTAQGTLSGKTFHMKEADASVTERLPGKKYLPLKLTSKQVLQFKYHYPNGEVKQSSLRLGNAHDGLIPCNPNYTGHVPGYSVNGDCGRSRGAVVRQLSATQRAPADHGEPLSFPGQTVRPEKAATPPLPAITAMSYLPNTAGTLVGKGSYSHGFVDEPRHTGVASWTARASAGAATSSTTAQLGTTRQLTSLIKGTTKQLFEPTGSAWLYTQHMQDRKPEAWLHRRTHQEISNSFTSSRMYAGCGRC